MADATDLKSVFAKAKCGFESRRRHLCKIFKDIGETPQTSLNLTTNPLRLTCPFFRRENRPSRNQLHRIIKFVTDDITIGGGFSEI